MSDGEEGDVFSHFLHIGFAQRNFIIASRNASFVKLFSHIIDALALEKDPPGRCLAVPHSSILWRRRV